MLLTASISSVLYTQWVKYMALQENYYTLYAPTIHTCVYTYIAKNIQLASVYACGCVLYMFVGVCVISRSTPTRLALKPTLSKQCIRINIDIGLPLV